MNEIQIDTHNLINNIIHRNDITNNRLSPELELVVNKIRDISQLVFDTLGTGFSEYIYHRALEVELRQNNIEYETKKIIPILYKNINIGYGEADLVIHVKDNKKLILELKAISNSPREIEIAQVYTYLKSIPDSVLGMVINFPQPSTKKAKEMIDFELVYPKD